MKTSDQIEAKYRAFVADTGGRCWRCGRGWSDRPKWWWAEWRLDPHHIVNKPRKRDRRACIVLCAACHSIQHIGPSPDDSRERLSLPELLAIKKFVDPDCWDRKFLQTCSIRRLPRTATLNHVKAVSWSVRHLENSQTTTAINGRDTV